ncbi:nucleotide kinase domain-containing protein [Pseudomonas huaxiensis]|uniref:nucleotide kinase domain-containing protein n=1 Tax=Pseudomonas huaxiensis TaxID=2213017 RepID=UPI001300746E|nr:nucleotide kinase domain-containing protein [Pseudomonas huaxiensis]
MKKLEKSVCYDEYWRFAYARQLRYVAKKTSTKIEHIDPILDQYKFTNCYRATDRVSQYLIKNITNCKSTSRDDVFFRILIFKIFNKISTWELLESKIGNICASRFNINEYTKYLNELKEDRQKIYSAAYIMPSGMQYGSNIKHVNNLRMIQQLLDSDTASKVWGASSLEEIYQIFIRVPSIGKFLALQLAIDCAYSSYSTAEESQFVIAGPGAERGIKKCFPTATPDEFTRIISHMHETQESEFKRLGLNFHYLESRKLQLIDCQNIFCELDKYLRVKLPEFNIETTRIKQLYKPNKSTISFELPHKWTREN